MQKSLHSFFEPDVLTATDYYPFGMEMPGRKYNPQGYRYGFNGKENDRSGEWGLGLVQDYGFRLYNPGLGRFFSVDPLRESYPELTPYQFASNTPIQAIDLDGLEATEATTPSGASDAASSGVGRGGGTRGASGTRAPNNPTGGVQRMPNTITKPPVIGVVSRWQLMQQGAANAARITGRLVSGTVMLFFSILTNPGHNHHAPGSSSAPGTSTAPDTDTDKDGGGYSTVTRVQTDNKFSKRINVFDDGMMSIAGATVLYITIDDIDHTQYFYDKKKSEENTTGVHWVQFKIPRKLANEIRAAAVPQKGNSGVSIQKVDDSQSPSAYGVSGPMLNKIRAGYVKGSAAKSTVPPKS